MWNEYNILLMNVLHTMYMSMSDIYRCIDANGLVYIKFCERRYGIWFEVGVSLQSFIHLLPETISKNIYLR